MTCTCALPASSDIRQQDSIDGPQPLSRLSSSPRIICAGGTNKRWNGKVSGVQAWLRRTLHGLHLEQFGKQGELACVRP